MEMVLDKQDLGALRNQLNKEGYIIFKNFFNQPTIVSIREDAKYIFQIQFDKFGYCGEFKDNMISLFTEHEEIFKNCGKLIQTGLISLYQLSTHPNLIKCLKGLGIELPNMCTRPVLFFNHPKLAKEEAYYKTPPHQDFQSIESSLDSVVVWVPLVEVNKENGGIKLYPRSHKNGPLPYKTNSGFAEVERPNIEFIQPELEIGDILIFSTLLVHESGEIKDDSIRFSASFRYTNMLETDFIKRGYPSLYQYIPITKQNDKNII